MDSGLKNHFPASSLDVHPKGQVFIQYYSIENLFLFHTEMFKDKQKHELWHFCKDNPIHWSGNNELQFSPSICTLIYNSAARGDSYDFI